MAPTIGKNIELKTLISEESSSLSIEIVIQRPSKSHNRHISACFTQLILVFLMTGWLVILGVMATSMRMTINRLDIMVNKLAAGSQEVPEEIQKCHSLSRQLQINQTQIFSQLAFMVHRLTNFSNLISVIQSGLVDVQSKLHGSPELVNVPNHLKELTASVANFGSQIQDFVATTQKLAQEQKSLSKVVDEMKLNVTAFNGVLNDLRNTVNQNMTKPSNESEEADKKLVSLIMDKLNVNISRINQTLTHRLSWVIDDQKRDHGTIDVLQEKSANLSSHLMTLQNSFSNLSSNCSALSNQIHSIQDDITKFAILSGQNLDSGLIHGHDLEEIYEKTNSSIVGSSNTTRP